MDLQNTKMSFFGCLIVRISNQLLFPVKITSVHKFTKNDRKPLILGKPTIFGLLFRTDLNLCLSLFYPSFSGFFTSFFFKP